MRQKKIEGFTLLELIIVLALLAIIVSVAVIRFVDMHKKALDVVEHATMASLRSAVLLYRAENDVWPDGDEGTWSPFELLANPPPYIANRATADGITWDVGRYGGGGGPDHWIISCPHAVGGDSGWVWSYMFETGEDTYGNEIHSAGSVVKIDDDPTWFIGH